MCEVLVGRIDSLHISYPAWIKDRPVRHHRLPVEASQGEPQKPTDYPVPLRNLQGPLL